MFSKKSVPENNPGSSVFAPRCSRRNLLRTTVTGAASIAASSLLLPRFVRAGLVDVHGNPLDAERFSPSAVGGGHSGNLSAITAVLRGNGLYIGNEFHGWSDAQRYSAFSTIRSWGFDFVCPKVGSYGRTWYSNLSQLRGWRDKAHRIGLGFAPFIYSVPNTTDGDAKICADIANLCGIIVVDMEQEWAKKETDMTNFGSLFRSTNPRSPIIVTGYGDPITRFGAGGWPFSQMAYWADGYAPQWYFGLWSKYGGSSSNVKTAINWADGECASAFGASFPICPNLSVYSNYNGSGYIPNTDLTTAEVYAKNWKAPIIWWEYQGMNASRAAVCIA